MAEWEMVCRDDNDLDLFLDLGNDMRIEIMCYLKYRDTHTDLWVEAGNPDLYGYDIFFRLNDMQIYNLRSVDSDEEMEEAEIDDIKRIAVEKIGYFLRDILTDYFSYVKNLGGVDFQWYELSYE